jgi:single-strand DNA-binding protein
MLVGPIHEIYLLAKRFSTVYPCYKTPINVKNSSFTTIIRIGNKLNLPILFITSIQNLSTMIKMQVIGHLGKDCVVNTVNGKNVINFTVAHTEKYRDSQGNNQEKTTWVDCAYWTDRTALSPYLTKGKQVFVEGTPEVRSFTRQDGTGGASLSLRVREVQLLGGKGEGASAPAYSGASSSSSGGHVPSANEITEPIDDLPF